MNQKDGDMAFSVMSVAQAEAIEAILDERMAQDAMWGQQTHDPAYWLAILGKQTGQLGEAILNYKWADDGVPSASALVKMYEEATQASAVLMAFMEAIEDDRLLSEVTSTKPEPRKLARVLERDDESLHARAVEDHDDVPVAPPLVYVDKNTGQPCPTRGKTLCTINHPEHLHVSSMVFKGAIPMQGGPVPYPRQGGSEAGCY